jgi:hypothetical protein
MVAYAPFCVVDAWIGIGHSSGGNGIAVGGSCTSSSRARRHVRPVREMLGSLRIGTARLSEPNNDTADPAILSSPGMSSFFFSQQSFNASSPMASTSAFLFFFELFDLQATRQIIDILVSLITSVRCRSISPWSIIQNFGSCQSYE